ncbi:MAG TPA: DUF6159 family protein [Verrucomicrobiae bacterium]|jgi:hypothetical protein|nr:DUF6159 family protein [Verrucomicrobiae bacterium]
MNKINRSFRLLKTAIVILSREKKLLLFPLLASGLALIVALFFLAPIALYPSGHSYLSTAHWSAIGKRISEGFMTPPNSVAPNHTVAIGMRSGLAGGGYLIFQHGRLALFFAVAYFVSMFLATFCNVAFYHEIMQALNGNAVSIRRGFHFAKTRWRAVLMWSLFAGIVGYIIQFIEQRVGFLGKIIASAIGFVWSVACIFAIPTLVRDTETTNPVKLLRHSAGTLKRTWGELVVGFVGFNLAATLIIVPFVILIVAISFAGRVAILAPLIIFPVMFLLMLPLSWLKNVVNAVYRCALFIYATEGVIPEPFDKDLLDSAWKVK